MANDRTVRIEGLLDAEDKMTNLDPGHMAREEQLKKALASEDPEESSSYEQSKASHRSAKSNPMRHLGRMRYFA